jgi:hypothetical protein
LALFHVDHNNVVVQGLPILNRAIETGELQPLRKLIKSLPFDESKELVVHFRKRVTKLKQVGAPQPIIEAEERRLASVVRPAPKSIDKASLEELRLMLGRWCSEARSVDLDKAWDLLHWFCDPARRRRKQGEWRGKGGAKQPSAWDYALHGHQAYPLDVSGQALIKTAGNEDDSSYNPPQIVVDIAAAISETSPDDWKKLDAKVNSGKAESQPYLAEIDNRLDYVGPIWQQFSQFYQKAASRGFGVSVEYYQKVTRP